MMLTELCLKCTIKAFLSQQVQLCLVVNKIDRLILELQLQPHEAYDRIKGIITQVNMIVSAFESENFISEADAVLAHENIKANADAGYAAAQRAWVGSQPAVLGLMHHSFPRHFSYSLWHHLAQLSPTLQPVLSESYFLSGHMQTALHMIAQTAFVCQTPTPFHLSGSPDYSPVACATTAAT